MRFIVVIMIAFLLTSCSGTGLNSDGSIKLRDSEINLYKGELLTMVDSLPDNSIAGPQKVDINKYRLVINGLVLNEKSLTYNEVLSHNKYTKLVTLYCIEGWSAKILWEGVLMKELLDDAVVDKKANTVIFFSQDGYSTSLPLKTIIEKEMILAYKMNNVVLPEERGFPFQLVAEDKLGYKWAKWIIRIELSDDNSYKGYWEQRGYNNEADVEN